MHTYRRPPNTIEHNECNCPRCHCAMVSKARHLRLAPISLGQQGGHGRAARVTDVTNGGCERAMGHGCNHEHLGASVAHGYAFPYAQMQ